MKKELVKMSQELYYYKDTKRILGVHAKITSSLYLSDKAKTELNQKVRG